MKLGHRITRKQLVKKKKIKPVVKINSTSEGQSQRQKRSTSQTDGANKYVNWLLTWQIQLIGLRCMRCGS